jgi:hypothetical protein
VIFSPLALLAGRGAGGEGSSPLTRGPSLHPQPLSPEGGREKKDNVMAGYSGTPLAKKLGIKPSHVVGLVNAPPNFEALLEALPLDVTLSRDIKLQPAFDVVVLFSAGAKPMRDSFPMCMKKLTPAGSLWVAWYKQSSGIATDLTEDIVRTFGLAAGLVDNKVCAIDSCWSGLRFVVRLKDRPKHQ